MVPAEPQPSTWSPSGIRSGAGWIACADVAVQAEFLESLSDVELAALPWLFEFWALEHQLPPDGAWRSWVILGGRGAGKTRAGAEWVRGCVEGALPRDPGRCRRVALVAETLDQARDVMVMGESGILACSPPDRRPAWHEGKRRLLWPNGAEAQCFSAHDPETLRGPQFDAAWVDEFAKWKKAEATWDMLQFGMRLGDNPQVCVTTTPRNVKVLKDLLASPSTVSTHAPTEANRANLADGFIEEVRARYPPLFSVRQERRRADPPPQRLTFGGQRRHLIQIGPQFQHRFRIQAQPIRHARRHPRRQRQHRQTVERAVRLLIIGESRVARNAQQHRRHPEGQRDFPRRRLLGLLKLHVGR